MKVGMLSVLVGVIGMILIANLSTASMYLRLGEVVALHFLLGDVVVAPHYFDVGCSSEYGEKRARPKLAS